MTPLKQPRGLGFTCFLPPTFCYFPHMPYVYLHTAQWHLNFICTLYVESNGHGSRVELHMGQ